MCVQYRATTSVYTDHDKAYEIVHYVELRHPYIPILRSYFQRYRLFFYDIGFNIGWEEKWVWSVLPSGIDIGYDIVGFSTIS